MDFPQMIHGGAVLSPPHDWWFEVVWFGCHIIYLHGSWIVWIWKHLKRLEKNSGFAGDEGRKYAAKQ